ncbi:MAG: Modification methylase DpnIIB [Parcubacteria group bacterium ADurb.Bin316]|nr:MAG: Modification methylase DpnIIB [Parcubacteria group bacterium ADurb.Bin316]
MVFDNINFIDEFGKEQKLEFNNFYCVDCMKVLKLIPDKSIDLCIVDPPYGIGADKMTLGNGKRELHRGNWDSKPPNKDYFKELFRVSKNQIIWGANHFISKMPIDSSCWIFWDKGTGDNDFADGELAWTSFDTVVKKKFISWVGANAKEKNEKDRIHITQKPIALYTWLLNNYAHKGDKILDTHVGSASSLIACHRLGFEYIGFELDTDYYNLAQERLEAEKAQMTFFD